MTCRLAEGCPHGELRAYYCRAECGAEYPAPAAEPETKAPIAEQFAAINERLKQIEGKDR